MNSDDGKVYCTDCEVKRPAADFRVKAADARPDGRYVTCAACRARGQRRNHNLGVYTKRPDQKPPVRTWASDRDPLARRAAEIERSIRARAARS